jgi:hypothetical protein
MKILGKAFLFIGLFASVLTTQTGCSNAGTEKEAMDQFSPEVLKTAQTSQERQKALFKKAGGNYENLSAEEKAEFVQLNNGIEATAKQSWGYLSTLDKGADFGEQQKAANGQ